MEKYPLPIRITHWLMAVIILCMLAVGLYMTDLSKNDPMRDPLYSLHKSFGVIVFLLFVIRTFLRVRLGTPPMPEVISPIERKLAHLGHYAIYGLMCVMPLSGYLMTNAYGRPVAFFGIELPKLIDTNRGFGHAMGEVHEAGAYILIGLLVLHIAAVFKHRLLDKVDILQRMT